MNDQIINAEFNPSIKNYILFTGSLVLIISIVGIPLLLIWLFGIGQLVSRRYFENLKCHLTNHHLKFSKGVFFKVEKTIPLDNIQDLTFIENPILNYFGLKILKIETAGNSSSHSSDMKLTGILDCVNFKENVLKQREQNKNNNSVEENKSSTDNDSIIILKEIRDLLKDLNNK